jgi:3-isopropylmalate dehydrogenase
MRKKRYTVACLSGDGIGPEVTAEASRALAVVSGMHGFQVDEVHVPFGGDALRRFGHPLPQVTRAACAEADTMLVAATREPALEVLKAELDLRWRITRVCARGSELAVVSPLLDDAVPLAVDSAFRLAFSRRARLTSVGSSASWHGAIGAAAERWDGVLVDRQPFEAVVTGLLREPAAFDVIASEQPFAEALASTAAFAHEGTRMVASGRVGPDGKGMFGPTHGSALEIAGQGVANPSAMLLAAALMLGEGLGERSAARTLERGVLETLETGVRTPDMLATGAGATTREFMDTLLAALPAARRDTEFAGVVA